MRKRWLSLVVAVTLAGAIGYGTASAQSESDNGESAKTVTAILHDVAATTAEAQSAHVAGTFYNKAKPLTLDIVTSQAIRGGTVASQGMKFHVVVASPSVYLRADAKTLQKLTGDPTSRTLAGRWLQAPIEDDQISSVSAALDLGALVSGITYFAPGASKDDITNYHGQRAIPLHTTDTGGPITLYVAATGKPYLLGVVGVGKKNKVELRFTEYDAADLPTAPTDALDLGKLLGRSSSTTQPAAA